MMKVFAVFDAKAAAFGMPMFLSSRGLALRGFSDAVADPQSPLSQHPEDYTLYELGEYDCVSGKLTANSQPVHLYSASAVVAQLIEARKPKIVAPVVSEEVTK